MTAKAKRLESAALIFPLDHDLRKGPAYAYMLGLDPAKPTPLSIAQSEDKSNLTRAVIITLRTLHSDPFSADLLSALIDYDIKLGNMLEAEKAFRIYARLAPNSPKTRAVLDADK